MSDEAPPLSQKHAWAEQQEVSSKRFKPWPTLETVNVGREETEENEFEGEMEGAKETVGASGGNDEAMTGVDMVAEECIQASHHEGFSPG